MKSRLVASAQVRGGASAALCWRGREGGGPACGPFIRGGSCLAVMEQTPCFLIWGVLASQVICCTCVGAGSAILQGKSGKGRNGMKNRSYAGVLVDEAAQARSPPSRRGSARGIRFWDLPIESLHYES